MSHIFISYSRKDHSYVKNLVASLRANQIPIWIDEGDINYGVRWFRSIVTAIRACAGVIVVMSDDSDQSDWVHKEILIGLQSGKPFYPLLLRGDGLPLLIDVQYADVRNGNLPAPEFYQELIAALHAYGVPIPLQEQISSFPFILINNQVAFTRYFALDVDCQWQGFAGAIFSEDGTPVNGLRVHVFTGNGLELYSISGSAPLYGLGGWEIEVAASVNSDTYFIELQTVTGLIISPTVQVTFPNLCDASLAIVNFANLGSAK